MAKKKNIHIALAFDENFMIPFYVMITSLFQNNKNVQISLHAIATGITQVEREQIENYVSAANNFITFYDVDINFIKSFAVTNKAHFTIATYYRLFFPYVLPKNIKRILYLDIDIIIIGKLYSLYTMPLDGLPIAAAADGHDVNKHTGISEARNYFNAGVLVIDLNKWRKMDVTAKTIKFLTDFPEQAPYHDQDGLNAALVDKWYKLSSKFNLTYGYITQHDNYLSFLKDKVIIHYNYSVKPWSVFSEHPLRYLFNDYFKSFLKTTTGIMLFKTNIDMVLLYSFIKFTEIQGNTLEDIMLLAFALHLGWISTLQSQDVNELREYYLKSATITEKTDPNIYSTEFEANKNALLYIYNLIFNKNQLRGKELIWLKSWISYLESRQSNSDRFLTPETINNKLGLSTTVKSMICSFILKVIK